MRTHLKLASLALAAAGLWAAPQLALGLDEAQLGSATVAGDVKPRPAAWSNITSGDWHIHQMAFSGAMMFNLQVIGDQGLNLYIFDAEWHQLEAFHLAGLGHLLFGEPQRIFVVVENPHRYSNISYQLNVVDLTLR